MNKWIYQEYSLTDDGGYLNSSLCDPLYAEERKNYIINTYKASTIKEEEVKEMFIDFGGMICKTDPVIEIPINEYKTFSCWKHQGSIVLTALLHKTKKIDYNNNIFYRFSRWPNLICFILKNDYDIVVSELQFKIDQVYEIEHQINMREALIKATIAAHPNSNESEIRKLFQQKQPN